jgi:hypothetical protein
MFSFENKKGAEESNMIIFIILALVVAGLVIFFSWGFFSKGSDILDGTDPVIQTALQSCKVEMSINKDSWCTGVKYVPYARAKQYMTCDYLNNQTGKTIKETPECNLAKVNEAISNYCIGLYRSSPSSLNEFINGQECTIESRDATKTLSLGKIEILSDPPKEETADPTSPEEETADPASPE